MHVAGRRRWNDPRETNDKNEPARIHAMAVYGHNSMGWKWKFHLPLAGNGKITARWPAGGVNALQASNNESDSQFTDSNRSHCGSTKGIPAAMAMAAKGPSMWR